MIRPNVCSENVVERYVHETFSVSACGSRTTATDPLSPMESGILELWLASCE